MLGALFGKTTNATSSADNIQLPAGSAINAIKSKTQNPFGSLFGGGKKGGKKKLWGKLRGKSSVDGWFLYIYLISIYVYFISTVYFEWSNKGSVPPLPSVNNHSFEPLICPHSPWSHKNLTPSHSDAHSIFRSFNHRYWKMGIHLLIHQLLQV